MNTKINLVKSYYLRQYDTLTFDDTKANVKDIKESGWK